MTPPPAQTVQQIPVGQIVPNPHQPRRTFAPDQIRALAQSIGSQGVVQPIVVRPHPSEAGRFELVAGERRLRAIRLLGWPAAPALVREIADDGLLEAALVENIQREPLSPIEEALAYRDLLDQHGYTQETLSRRVGKDRSTIANMIRLLALPETVQQDLEAGKLTIGHARALLAIADAARMRQVHRLIVAKGLSVRETEALVAHARDRGKGGAPGARARTGAEDADLPAKWQAVQDRLERKLGTKVTLDLADDQASGRLSVDFYDLDDFNRIYDLLKGR